MLSLLLEPAVDFTTEAAVGAVIEALVDGSVVVGPPWLLVLLLLGHLS